MATATENTGAEHAAPLQRREDREAASGGALPILGSMSGKGDA